MSTTMIKKPTTRSCNRCGAVGLTWKKSTRTGRWYLSEAVMRRGYTGKEFASSQLHKCPTTKPLNTEPPRQYYTAYGMPEGPIENPETHTCRTVMWRKAPGSDVTGVWCAGCRFRLVD